MNLYFGNVMCSGGQFDLYISNDGFSRLERLEKKMDSQNGGDGLVS